jgi:signal peptidase II
MICFLLLVGIDQYFKHLALQGFAKTNFFLFKLTLLKNHGVMLGFLSHLSSIWIAITQITLLMVIYFMKPPKWVMTFCLAGGLSNLIDRLYYGYIVDYIHFHIHDYHWPTVINLADLYLCIGISLWLYDQYNQSNDPVL